MRLREAVLSVAQPRSFTQAGAVTFGGVANTDGTAPDDQTSIGIFGVTRFGQCVFGAGATVSTGSSAARFGRARFHQDRFN
jgi:hypothetical protein